MTMLGLPSLTDQQPYDSGLYPPVPADPSIVDPAGHFTTTTELQDYRNPDAGQDVFEAFPGMFDVQSGSTVAVSQGNYRTLQPGGGVMLPGSAVYNGFAFRETSGGAPAFVRFHDGLDSGGPIVDTVAMTAGQSMRAWIGTPGIKLKYGLYAEVSGAVEGAIYTVADVLV